MGFYGIRYSAKRIIPGVSKICDYKLNRINCNLFARLTLFLRRRFLTDEDRELVHVHCVQFLSNSTCLRLGEVRHSSILLTS